MQCRGGRDTLCCLDVRHSAVGTVQLGAPSSWFSSVETTGDVTLVSFRVLIDHGILWRQGWTKSNDAPNFQSKQVGMLQNKLFFLTKSTLRGTSIDDGVAASWQPFLFGSLRGRKRKKKWKECALLIAHPSTVAAESQLAWRLLQDKVMVSPIPGDTEFHRDRRWSAHSTVYALDSFTGT